MKDSLSELMLILEEISGIQLKSEKRSMVETRLARRVRALGLDSLDDYIKYFHQNRSEEMVHAVSLVTTHTTEFFREDAHFDYLFENIFPQILAGQNQIRIWSAASSTGQEVYSLAISILEYIRLNNISIDRTSNIQILGTDIDQISIRSAQEGIYPYEQIKHLHPELIERYFDRGNEDLEGYVRVKDTIHKICQFRHLNLLSDDYPGVKMDVIFLRNVIIYFKPLDIERILIRLKNALSPDGFLFLGHSESLTGQHPFFKKVGNSVYSLGPKKSDQNLIVIGASTGGVEALKVVLEQFSVGCPPILIVQHIPGNFSKPFANRLNEICTIKVSEAVDKEIIEASHAYIAPGGKQMKLRKTSAGLMIEINDDPPMGLHKPSVDYLFQSIVSLAKDRSISAALLTGMGSDGARGLKDLRNVGVYTVVQNEETSIVFGMPGVAVEMGGAVDVVPLKKIANKLLVGFAKK